MAKSVSLWAFDLIEPNRMIFAATPGLRLNEHLDHDDACRLFEHACRLGLEGIASKRRDSPYRSGRSRGTI